MVFDKIKELIVEQFMISNPDEITLATSFVDDLEADSLDIVEMIMDLETELGVELDMEDQKITTFQELADFIESKLN